MVEEGRHEEREKRRERVKNIVVVDEEAIVAAINFVVKGWCVFCVGYFLLVYGEVGTAATAYAELETIEGRNRRLRSVFGGKS